jgi:hypothetical protein
MYPFRFNFRKKVRRVKGPPDLKMRNSLVEQFMTNRLYIAVDRACPAAGLTHGSIQQSFNLR